MKVVNDLDNLVFNDSDPRCVCITVAGPEGLFAFIQVLDVGNKGCRHNPPHVKRLWGRWDWINREEAVREIMSKGNKWPELPSYDSFIKYNALEYPHD